MCPCLTRVRFVPRIDPEEERYYAMETACMCLVDRNDIWQKELRKKAKGIEAVKKSQWGKKKNKKIWIMKKKKKNKTSEKGV